MRRNYRPIWMASLVTLGSIMLIGQPAQGRFIENMNFETLASESDALAVGTVVKVFEDGKIPAEETKWKSPLLAMRARFHILRVFSKQLDCELTEGSSIDVEYEAVDSSKVYVLMNGPCFPRFQEGETAVLPLIKSSDGAAPPKYEWTNRTNRPGLRPMWWLIREEDCGLIVPALSIAPKHNNGETGEDFIWAEFLNVFQKDSFDDVFRACSFWPTDWSKTYDRLKVAMPDTMDSNAEQWHKIGIGFYSRFYDGLSISRLLEENGILDVPESSRLHASHAIQCLGKADPAEIETKTIGLILDHAYLDPVRFSQIIVDHYATRPETLAHLREGLQKGNWQAAYIASRLVKSADDPLTAPAVSIAETLVGSEKPGDLVPWYEICTFVVRYSHQESAIKKAEAWLKARDLPIPENTTRRSLS